MLHCKSSLKAVLCSWHLTLSEPKQQTKKLSSAKTFPKRRAVSAGAVKAPGRGSAGRLGSGDPCALPQPMLGPMDTTPSRALSFVEMVFRHSPPWSHHILPQPQILLGNSTARGKSSGSAMQSSTAPPCWQSSADLS